MDISRLQKQTKQINCNENKDEGGGGAGRFWGGWKLKKVWHLWLLFVTIATFGGQAYEGVKAKVPPAALPKRQDQTGKHKKQRRKKNNEEEEEKEKKILRKSVGEFPEQQTPEQVKRSEMKSP